MLSDIYMIILTAFAVFGLFCIAEEIITAIRLSDAPKSVTVLLYDRHFDTYNTVQYIHNTLYNNEIIMLSEDSNDICPLATTVTPDELHKYITNALFTKN